MPCFPSNPILSNVTVNSTVDPLNPTIPARAGRQGMILQAPAGVDIYIGDATVTTSGGANPGILIKGGQTVPISVSQSVSTGPLWAIAATSGNKLTVLEWA